MWPFYNHQRVQLEQGGTYELVLMPLIMARERSPAGGADAVIWPFFQHITHKREHWVKDYFPWPFIVRGRGRNLKQDQVWPFWMSRTENGNSHVTVLWPFCWFNKGRTSNSKTSSSRVFPFFYAADETWDKDHTSRTYLQVWPLFHQSGFRDGRKKLEALSPIWLRENDGWERNWAPFFWVYQEESDPNKKTESKRVLWRVVRFESSPRRRITRIKPLFINLLDEDGRKWLCLPGGFVKIPLGKGTTKQSEQEDNRRQDKTREQTPGGNKK